MENPKNPLSSIKIDKQSFDWSKYLLSGIAVLIVFASSIVLYSFIPSTWAEISQNSTLIQEETTKVSNMEKAVAVLNNVNSSQIGQNLIQAQLALPDEKRVTGLVSALTTLASSSGATVSQIDISFGKVSTSSGKTKPVTATNSFSQFEDTKLPNDVVGVPIILEVTGTSDQVLALIGKVQEALPLLDIRDMEYIVSDDKQSSKLSVLVYAQPGEVFNLSKVDKISPITYSEQNYLNILNTKTDILQ